MFMALEKAFLDEINDVLTFLFLLSIQNNRKMLVDHDEFFLFSGPSTSLLPKNYSILYFTYSAGCPCHVFFLFVYLNISDYMKFDIFYLIDCQID